MLHVTWLFTNPYHIGLFRCCEECTDPFDMLDWIKNRNESGHAVAVIHWTYAKKNPIEK